MMDIFGTPANRKFLDELLKEITGKDWAVKTTVEQNLPVKGDRPAQTQSKPRPEDFKNDPQIQDALEIFKGTIKTKTD